MGRWYAVYAIVNVLVFYIFPIFSPLTIDTNRDLMDFILVAVEILDRFAIIYNIYSIFDEVMVSITI